MTDALRNLGSQRFIPQSEPARADQVKNAAGGYVFQVSDATHLNRFLTLGAEGGTYYTKEPVLAKENAQAVMKLAKASDPQLLDQAVIISVAGRAPRNNPALFAVAAAAGLGNRDYRHAALNDALQKVARTGSHLLTFAGYAEQFRGWGPQLVKGIAAWYNVRPVEELAFQLLKYKSRGKWAQRDLLRLAHLSHEAGTYAGAEHRALYRYITHDEAGDLLPQLVHDVAELHATADAKKWADIIRRNRSVSWEMLPSEALNSPEVWAAMLENGNLATGAMLRELPRLTRLGLTVPMSVPAGLIEARLTDEEALKKARIHPIAVLLALKTYASGHSLKGKSSWQPSGNITEALNSAFYLAFPNAEPCGKRIMEVTDTSGSMTWEIAGLPFTAVEAAGAMALVSARTEPHTALFGFASECFPLAISKSMRLDDVMRLMAMAGGGSTDCAAPMLYAKQHGLQVDVFRIWTDNETWYGRVHPFEALQQYRAHTGIPARLQVCAMTPTRTSIADPDDPGQLDVCGFDAAVPKLLADHGRGDL